MKYTDFREILEIIAKAARKTGKKFKPKWSIEF